MSDHSGRSGEAYSPGKILSRHELKRSVRRRAAILLAASLIVVLAASAWSIYRWYFAFARFGPAIVWRWSGPAIGIALLATSLAIYAGWFLIRNHQRAVYSSEEGLWFVNGRNQRLIPWTDLASIQISAAAYTWSRSDNDTQMRISINTLGGETVRIPSSLTKLDELHQIIKQRIYPMTMNRYREMMNKGQPLDFGPIKLTRSGVTYRKRVEPWQNFREVSLERGRLKIEFQRPKGSQRISIAARHVPNVDLCVQLLRNIEY
ncbi:MAG: hypothetical protein P1P76_08450 [Anaerolineales bacterium]|nr:hypothetical protein [Anaerolineales bacterium]